MKKQLRATTAAVLATSTVLAVVAPIPTADAATYKDVSSKANYYAALQALTKEGIITGYADGTFRPNAKITRGQLAKILTRLLDLETTQSISFNDVSNDHDFYRYASAVVAAGYMDKQNGSFNAAQTITRNEYAAVLTRAFNLQGNDVALPFSYVNPTYKKAIQAVYANGLMRGVTKTNFNGSGNVTRSQLVLTLHKAIEKQEEQAANPPNAGAKVETLEITTVNASSFVADDKTYSTPAALKKLFTTTNADLLKNAELEVEMKNGQIVAIKKLTILNNSSKTKTLDGANSSYDFPIVIQIANAIIKNATLSTLITGDDATGGITLQNVNVKDSVVIEDSYLRTFNVQADKSSIQKLDIQRNNVTVSSTTKIPNVFVSDDAYEMTINSAVGLLQFERAGYLTLYGTGSVDQLNMYYEAYLYIRSTGQIGKLVVDNPNASVNLSTTSRIQQAIIPANTDYDDVFGFPGSLQSYVSKISYPNSSLNLLAQEVIKPSKEEIALQRAIENVIKDHVHTVDGKALTLRTSFNEILLTMKTLSFEQRLYLVDTTATGSIPYTIYKGGTNMGSGTIDLEQFSSGISLQDLANEVKTFENFTSNSSVSYTIRFDTERELKIRSTVFVNGTAKNSAESTINPGNATSMEDAVKAAIKAFTPVVAATAPNTIAATLEVNQINDIIREVGLAHIVKVTSGLDGLTTVPLTVRRNNQLVFTGDVLVSDLKNGYKVPSSETFAQFSDNSEIEYTYEFGTTQAFEVDVALQTDVYTIPSPDVVKVNPGVTPDAGDIVTDFSVDTSVANRLLVNTTFGANTSGTGTLDALLKVTNGIDTSDPNKERKVTVFYKSTASDGTVLTERMEAAKDVLVKNSDLDDGILLSEILNASSPSPQPTNIHRNRTDEWEIVVDSEASPLDFTVSLVNSISGNVVELATASSILNPTVATQLRNSVTNTTFTKTGDQYVLTPNFTSSTSIKAEWPVSFIIEANASTATAPIDITATKASTSLDPLSFTNAEISFNVNDLKLNAQPLTPLTFGTAKDVWKFKFSEEPTAIKATVNINHYKVKEISITP